MTRLTERVKRQLEKAEHRRRLIEASRRKYIAKKHSTSSENPNNKSKRRVRFTVDDRLATEVSHEPRADSRTKRNL